MKWPGTPRHWKNVGTVAAFRPWRGSRACPCMAPGRGATCAATPGAQHLFRSRRPGGLVARLLGLLETAPELLQPGPLLGDQLVELRALRRRQVPGHLVLHLL